MMIAAGLLSIIAIGTGAALEPRKVFQWSNAEPVVGEVVAITDQGIEIREEQQIIPVTIPWYDFRTVDGSGMSIGAYQQIADDAWRAHARLARGDFYGAELIYTRLEEKYLWKTGPQSGDVSIGLVMCRLDRQDRAQAVKPYLSWLGSVDSLNPTDLDGVAGFDLEYKLLTDLPPVFGPKDRKELLSSIEDTVRLTNRQQALYGLFQLAQNTQIHRTAESNLAIETLKQLMRGRENRDPGLEFIEDLVVAQAHEDIEKRNAARHAIERRIRAHSGTWIELWGRLAVGVSLLGEEDTDSNERGVIELIHVVVRLDHVSQPLAAVASQLANEYFVRTNRSQWGDELMLEARTAWATGITEALSKEQAAHE